MPWIDEWEGSEEELIGIAEESIFNYSMDNPHDEADEFLKKLYLEALSRSDIQAMIHEKMQNLYKAHRIATSPRLTGRDVSGTAYLKCFDGNPCEGCGCEIENCNLMNSVCEKLAYYEEEEEKRNGIS